MSIYQPTFLSPKSITIDASSSPTFFAQVNGTYADYYQMMIYDLSNNIKYNSNALALSTILYQNDQFSLNLPANTIQNGQEYFWSLSLWSDSLPTQQCFSYNAATSTFTDETTSANNSLTNDMHLVPIGTVQDAYYFGNVTPFGGINLNIGTAGSYSATLIWEYYSGTLMSWNAIPIITDNTSGFTKSGTVLFQIPFDWGILNSTVWTPSTAYPASIVVHPIAVNGHIYTCTTAGISGSTAPTWSTTSGGTVTDGTVVWTESGISVAGVASNSSLYWIRCRVSAFTSKTTSPLGTQCFYKNSATSRQTPFFAYSTPTVSMTVSSTISSMANTFTATYLQAQGVPINYWYMVFLDSNNNIILQTDNSYSGNISYNYSGFISGNSYQVYTVVVNQQGITTQSPTYSFSVSYFTPNLIIVPTATVLTDLSAVQVSWSLPVTVTGTVTGTSSYVPGLFNPNNTGLKLNASSYIEYDLTIPIGFTATVVYIPDPTFVSGLMLELDDSVGNAYQIGYNGTQFYYINNSVTILGKAQPLPSGAFLIAVKGIEVLIIYNNQIYDDIHP